MWCNFFSFDLLYFNSRWTSSEKEEVRRNGGICGGVIGHLCGFKHSLLPGPVSVFLSLVICLDMYSNFNSTGGGGGGKGQQSAGAKWATTWNGQWWEKTHFSWNEMMIYNCIYSRPVYSSLYLKQKWVGLIIIVSLLYIYSFLGCSPSVSQAESQEEVKKESEKKPDDVCWQ